MFEVLTPCPVVLCLVYLSPGSDQNAVTSLLNSLTPIIQKHRAIILGDFNFPDINWDALTCSSPSSKLFCDFVFEHNLQQFVREPTHYKGNILDLVLSNFPELILDINIHSSNHLPSMSSDHYPISISIPCVVHRAKKAKLNAPLFNFSKGNYTLMNNYISSHDFSPFYSSTDVEFLWSH